ncbi:hypothetical protein V5799_017738 [Amblyomma americanum]|uniref:Secreted protein n=1 Tax=Amblyomma americanum TaxID=6943 RepID=A0AAQ4F1X1_AMBAM
MAVGLFNSSLLKLSECFRVCCLQLLITQDTTYEELFETLKCLLTALSKQDLVTIATGAICDIVKLFKKADIGVDILTLPVRAGFSVLAGLTC